LIASNNDVLLVNLQTGKEYDIDDCYQISKIRSMVYVDNKFYVLANKCNRILGYYLIELDINALDDLDPRCSEPAYIVH